MFFRNLVFAATVCAAGGKLAMPPVSFRGQQMDNRVDGLEGIEPFTRWRVTAVDNEMGGTVGVQYSAPECKPSSLPEPHANDKRCYPQSWTPSFGTPSSISPILTV